jgi:hypothetical protein
MDTEKEIHNYVEDDKYKFYSLVYYAINIFRNKT